MKPWHGLALFASLLFPPLALFVIADIIGAKTKALEEATACYGTRPEMPPGWDAYVATIPTSAP